MKNVYRVAVVDPNDATRDMLKAMLLGMEMVWLEAECSRYEFFSDVVAQTHPDVGVVVLDSDNDKGLELVSEMNRIAPECSVLVISSSSDGSFILKAMRAGAKEFLTHPLSMEDLLSALERISNNKFGVGNAKPKSTSVIAVAGATGGVGTTSLAVNLGSVLAADKANSVVLLDIDLCLGDADVLLDAIPEYTLLDVAENISRLDFTLLKRSLTRHSTGLFLLPRPIHLEDIKLITSEQFKRVVGLLKATFSHLIIDLSKSYGPLDRVAMDACDQLLLVTQLDLPCLRNVVRLNLSLGEIEGIKEKLKIIVNRVGLDSGQISLKKATDTIGREIYWQIPNDYRTMSDMRNNGVPLIELAPKAGITQSIVRLANALSGNEVEEPESNTKNSGIGKWLSRWQGKPKVQDKEEE